MRVWNNRSALHELFLAGKNRWPALSISFEAFAAHCSRVLPEDEEPAPSAADLYLCCACAACDPEALRAFEREGAGVAEAAIRRIDDNDDFVRDSLQELWQKLLVGENARVRSYSGRGPIKAWVRVAATRVALDRQRAKNRNGRRHVELTERLAAADLNPEVFLLKARFGEAFQDALRAAVAELSEQERNVLRMHVAGSCSIDEIGDAYGVHRATAARWIERSRTKIHDLVCRDLCVRHQLTSSEFNSIAALIGAELELSLGFSTKSAAAIGRRSETAHG